MSVEFEPVRLGRRSRRFDPVSVAAVLVVVGLVVAVLKPWAGDGQVGGGSSPVAGAVATPAPLEPNDIASPGPSASLALPRVIRASAGSVVSWSEVEPVFRWHDAWGIRAIVVQPLADTPVDKRQQLVERWYPLSTGGDSGRPTRVDSNDRAILALGVTFPPAHTPLDVRFWRKTADRLDWVDTAALDSIPSGGAYLFVRPGATGGLQRSWEPGDYRVDVLVDGLVSRFAITIPDRSSNVPEPGERPSLRSTGPLVEPESVLLSDLPVGAFATSHGVAVPLAAVEGPPLDEAGAWLNVDPGTGRRPRSFVAATYLPRATGIGVALPTRAVVTSAAIERLAPEPLAMPPEQVGPGAGSELPASLVLFKAPRGAWDPGVYRVSLVWADVEGLHRDSWHVELRPGPVRETAPMLSAARDWARFAGETGVILGTAEPLVGGSTAGVIELVPLRPESVAYPVPNGTGCGGTVIGARPTIMGFAYPADRYATSVKSRILRPFLRRDDQVLMTAAFGVRGLILAAPARISTLPAAGYEFRVGSGDMAEVYSLCLGLPGYND